VFKSQVKKKTLAPEWNENFECPVIRRDNAELMLEVWDWDRLGAFELLCIPRLTNADLLRIEQVETTNSDEL